MDEESRIAVLVHLQIGFILVMEFIVLRISKFHFFLTSGLAFLKDIRICICI
jgi:hypothetical protein